MCNCTSLAAYSPVLFSCFCIELSDATTSHDLWTWQCICDMAMYMWKCSTAWDSATAWKENRKVGLRAWEEGTGDTHLPHAQSVSVGGTLPSRMSHCELHAVGTKLMLNTAIHLMRLGNPPVYYIAVITHSAPSNKCFLHWFRRAISSFVAASGLSLEPVLWFTQWSSHCQTRKPWQ